MNVKIKTILFDAYGTLINTSNGSVTAAQAILSKNNVSLDAASFYARWKVLHKEHINKLTSFLSEEEIFLKDLERLYEEFCIEGKAIDDVGIMLRTLGIRTAFPETNEVLNGLKTHYSIYIASTSDHAPLMNDVQTNGLKLDGVFSSELLKVYKPQKSFYLRILEELRCDPSEALFVGDSLDDDVWGPQSVGMKTVWINRKGQRVPEEQSAPDYIIQNLNELFDVLKRIGSDL